MQCTYCSATGKHPTRLPRGWKRGGDNPVCAKCWGQRYILRAVTIPIVGPVDGTWKELREDLRDAWADATALNNWLTTEYYVRDVTQRPGHPGHRDDARSGRLRQQSPPPSRLAADAARSSDQPYSASCHSAQSHGPWHTTMAAEADPDTSSTISGGPLAHLARVKTGKKGFVRLERARKCTSGSETALPRTRSILPLLCSSP